MRVSAVLLVVLCPLLLVSAESCHSISPQVTDAWCNANCNDSPPYCPPQFCSCGAAPTPPAPSPPSPPPAPSPPTPAAPSPPPPTPSCVPPAAQAPPRLGARPERRRTIGTWGAAPSGSGVTVPGLDAAVKAGLNTWFAGPVPLFKPAYSGLFPGFSVPKGLAVLLTVGGAGADMLGPTDGRGGTSGYLDFTAATANTTGCKLHNDLVGFGFAGADFDIESDCITQGSTPFTAANLDALEAILSAERMAALGFTLTLEAGLPPAPARNCGNQSKYGTNFPRVAQRLASSGALLGINLMLYDNGPLHADWEAQYAAWVAYLAQHQIDVPLNIGYPVQKAEASGVKQVVACIARQAGRPLDGIVFFPPLGNLVSFAVDVVPYVQQIPKAFMAAPTALV